MREDFKDTYMTALTRKTIAVLSTDGFEDSELTSPVAAVKAAGADVKVSVTIRILHRDIPHREILVPKRTSQ